MHVPSSLDLASSRPDSILIFTARLKPFLSQLPFSRLLSLLLRHQPSTESYSTTQKEFPSLSTPFLGPRNFPWNAPGASSPTKPMAGMVLNWPQLGASVRQKLTPTTDRLPGHSEMGRVPGWMSGNILAHASLSVLVTTPTSGPARKYRLDPANGSTHLFQISHWPSSSQTGSWGGLLRWCLSTTLSAGSSSS